jgi:hypothetical protein
MRQRIPVRFPALLSLLPVIVCAADVPAKIEYNRDVRPILADACFRCHGFDKNTREADRRLDTREGALAESEGIRAIVPGDLAKSDAWVRINSSDKDEVMPPAKANRQLTAREKEILKRWIEQGAEYQAHWAYLAVKKPEVPRVEEKHPIDSFVVAKQRELGLTPVGEADPLTLARRLHLDLTGLPPKPAEADRFSESAIRNPQSAIETLADTLLRSESHAERMTAWWLDLVRYADSIGYHSDNPRNVSPYRDYVLRAFRDNVRFDRFTREQLAGDLLPEATVETRVASAYNRLTLTTEEGGAQAKEYEHKSVVDRVKSVGTTWLGQTLMCSECHDHKYDPVTARDFYALGAFFADVKEAAIGRREEGMLVPTTEQSAKLADADAKLAALKTKLSAPSSEIDAAQAEWEKANANGPQDVPWTTLTPAKAYGDKASQLVVRADATVKVEAAGSPATDTYKLDVTLPAGATGVRLEVLPSDSLPSKGPGRAGNGNFVLNEIVIEREAKPLKLAQATATFEQPSFPAKNAIDGKDNPPLSNGWAVMGNTGKDAALYLELAEPVAAETAVTVLMRQRYGDNHTIGKFRLSATTAPKPIRAPNSGVPANVLAALKVAAAQRTAEQQKLLGEHYRTLAPTLAPLREEIATAQKAREALEKTITRSLVTEADKNLRTVRLLSRGNWMDDKGEVLLPATPHFLPNALTSTPEKRLTRLELAQWLVARDNPLTARVFVNRLWKQFFGTGLSKTLEDMGTQGEIPSHPELLDWLAAEFMDSGWDVRHMIRLMVTSRTYRLTSAAPRDLVQRDLANRYLARGGRWRLDAEFVRDNALSISGLLVTQFGGPSVKPYQPPGYWENLNFPTREWDNDKDRNQWRRGLYTWWQRSYPHPSMVAFDAPTREECAADRLRSNIPQQALALLNDPTYVEAARAFAARILREGGATSQDRIAWAWRQATARPAKPDELATLAALLDKHLARYGQDAPAAEAALKVGYAPAPDDLPKAELAAYTSVARAILNLHETITRL